MKSNRSLPSLFAGCVALAAFLFASGFDSAQAQTYLATVTNTAAFTISTNIPVPASSGGLYAIQKAASGKLTMSGQITGGAGSILRTTTDTTGDSTTIMEFTTASPTYTGNIQLWRGVVQADTALSLGTGTIECDGNNSLSGDLTFGASLAFTNPILLQESDTLGSGTFSVTLSGPITDGGGGYGFTKYGSGTLTLSGANAYGGTNTIGGSSGAGGTLALGVNNGLPAGNALTINNISGSSVLSLGTFNQNVGAITFYAGSATRTIITGTGTLALSGNLTLVDAHTSSQDFPLAISAPIDLNGATRTFSVGYGNNQDHTDLGDLHLNGVIMNSSGTAGITFTNWSNGTVYDGSVSLGAANTYNGPTTLAGGAVTGTSTLAVNANNAIPNGSAFIQSAGTVLDLTAFGASTGKSTGMGSLTGAGTITLGAAGILTIGYDNTSPSAYSGVIGGAGGAIIKTGTGTLTLSGANTYTGSTTVRGGTLLVNGSSASGTITVAGGAALGGSGTITTSFLIVSNGASVTAGNAAGVGTLTLNNLTLGVNPADAVTVNCTGNLSGLTGLFSVANSNGLTNNGTVTININGTLPAAAPAVYNLMTYSGVVKGSGTFVTGSLPAAGYVTNNATAHAIQLVVSSSAAIAAVTWVGAPTNNWDLQGSNVWVLTGSSTPVGYTNGDTVTFDDTASDFAVNVAALVSPGSTLITNNANNYVFTGSGGIAGLGLTKAGSGTVTLSTVNSYTGGTTISAGTVILGVAGAIPGSGSVNLNGTLDVGGTSPTLNSMSGTGLVDNASAGGSPVLNLAESSSSTFSGTIQNTTGSLELNLTGSSPLILTGTNTYTGGTVLGSPLQVGAGGTSGTVGSGPVTLNSTLTFDRADTNTILNTISGKGLVQQNGSGTAYLAGNLAFNGGLVANAGSLGIGSIILAGDTTSGGGLGATYTNYISIAAGATVQSSGTLTLYASSTLNPYIGLNGAGTLMLTATNNNANSPDISFDADDTTANATANWGDRIAAPINLGSVQRYFWGRTDHTSVDVYGVAEADCQFAGTISGSGGMTFVAQNNSSGSDGQLMETPFCLNASNTFTGPVQIQRGSVYLGAAGAYPAGNVLSFNVASGNNGKFFLYGHNTTVSDLSSTGAGAALIANGNRNPSPIGPATLTVIQNNPETYAGSIIDTNAEYVNTTTGAVTTLTFVKAGPATLTLTGPIAFSGPMAVTAGEVFINTVSSGGGAVTVNSGATLGGNGSIASAVTVSNGASIEAGGGAGLGALSVNRLALGANPATDATTLNCEAIPSGINSLNILAANGFTNNATVTVNVTGVMPATVPVVYNLVTYSGAIQGGGSFVLGSVPDQAVAYITNNTSASAIQLVVSSVIIPTVTWVGFPTNDWDLLGGDVWIQTGTSVPAAYADEDQVVFDDTATNFMVNLASPVSPDGVLFTNNANSYYVTGNGSISGYTSLTKMGTGSLTLATTNSYSGATAVSSGTLVLGVPGAIPGGLGAGNVSVNGILDVNGFSSILNNLSGGGVVDDVMAGGSPVLTVSNTTTSVFSGILQNTSGMLELALAGGGNLTLAGNNTYNGVTTINSGVLQIGAGGSSGTLGSGPVMDNGTLVLDRSDANTVANDIMGSGGIQQNGSGTVTLHGNLTYAGPTVANAGTLLFPDNVTFDAGAGSALTVAANAVVETGFEIFLNANAGSTAVDMGGAGTVRLVGAINKAESFADIIIGANNNGISTANYGIRIASGLDLGTTNRLFWATSSRDDVTTYGLTGCDCQFAGTLTGTALLTLLGKNSWPGVNTMEEQFAFNASNSWTGTLEVQRGSVYVGNSNAFTAGNVLILDPAAGVNSRFFLYGFNATVNDLQSGGYGDELIANGNNVTSSNAGPATLTITENNSTAFAGNIVDWYTEYTAPATGPKSPALSLVKNGAGTLTLTGANTYSGTTVINGGALFINNSSTGGGTVTVNTNATLGGSGIINSAVTIKNGGAIVTGDGTGNGTTQIKTLALGSVAGDQSVLNLTAAAILNVTNNNGLVMNGGAGSVTINVGGTIASPGAVPLITYNGTPGGGGYAAFQLGTVPAGVVGILSNDTANAAIDFVATQVTIPRWSGAFSTEWSTNVLASPKNWVLDSDGVTPLDYVDGENVKFEDGAAGTTVNIDVANVSPLSVTFNNSAQNYVIDGVYGITGSGILSKQGSGTVILGTTNSYSGSTTITAGTLSLGAAGAIPGGSGAGNVTVNGTLDVGGFSPTLNNLSGSGVVDNVSAGGSPVLNLNDTMSLAFAGVIKNTSGSLGVTLSGAGTLTLTGTNTYTGPTVINSGALVVNGSLAGGGVTVQNGAGLGGTGIIGGPVVMASSSAFNVTANSPLTVGALTLDGTVSVDVSGNVSVTNSATYILLDHGTKTGAGSFLLAPVAGIINSGYTATLDDTNNQLLLVVAPTQPTGTIADVKHVVIFMQENRSFDHYFGSLHGVHGYSDHIALTFTNGNSDFYQPSGSSYELPFHTTVPCLSDLAHDWTSTHEAWDSGNDDEWIAAKGTETMAYYNRSDISYYYSLADAYTICDEYHCATLTSTDPNRVNLMTGNQGQNGVGSVSGAATPLIDNTEPSAGWSTNWVTYPELLQKAGVSWQIFQAADNYDDNAINWFAAFKNAAVGSPLYNRGETFAPSIQSGTGFPADLTNLVAEFKGAVMSNTLPSVSWIIGPDVGSEHPSWSPEDGEILTKGLLDALASNPKVYNSTVFILNYDENDGFFDHAVPINPPAGTTNEFYSTGMPFGLGVRVPCIVISPWSTGGYVDSQVFDHTSVIRFLEKWTGVQEPNISAWRRQVCGDLTSALDFAHPNTNYTVLSVATENDCPSGSTASPPGTQTVPTQESGTLLERPLPYQPNATPVLNSVAGTFSIAMTNSGSVSVHFSVYPNAYQSGGPWPYDVNSSNSATSTAFSTTGTGGDYDFSSYGPNGFLRRFAGNISADSGNIESVAYLNPATGGFEITLANPSASPVVFTVTNGYFASVAAYPVAAGSTNVVILDTTTNTGWYDLAVTASSDPLFVRRFAGHIETNNAVPTTFVSSQNPSGYGSNVVFTTAIAGYGTPTGTVQFLTNGVTAGAPVSLAGGMAAFNTAALGDGTNLIAAQYSGDLLNPPVTNVLSQVVSGQPPVLTLNGAAVITNQCGTGFTDPGVTVIVGSSPIVDLTTNYTVNTGVPGNYIITYMVVDAAGNSATNTRTVVVQDTLPPVVTLNGPNPMTNWLGTVFIDPGATADDLCAGILPVTTNGVVNSGVAGTYILQYVATDLVNNSATNTRTVYVLAETAPVLSGGATLSDGSVQMTFSGPAGQPYRIMSGTDLSNMGAWTNYASGVFGSAPATFTDTNAPGQPSRFYRVVSP